MEKGTIEKLREQVTRQQAERQFAGDDWQEYDLIFLLRLGHSDISLTLNTYSQVLPEMQEEAAEVLDEPMTLTEVSEKEPNTVQERADEQVFRLLWGCSKN